MVNNVHARCTCVYEMARDLRSENAIYSNSLMHITQHISYAGIHTTTLLHAIAY